MNGDFGVVLKCVFDCPFKLMIWKKYPCPESKNLCQCQQQSLERDSLCAGTGLLALARRIVAADPAGSVAAGAAAQAVGGGKRARPLQAVP